MKNFIKGMFMFVLFSLMLIPAAIAACVDSDGGLIKDVYGEVDYNGEISADYCSVSYAGSFTINEYYCDFQNKADYISYNCAAYGYNSCQAGACVNIADPLAIVGSIEVWPQDNSAIIEWDTNKVADSTVFYGLTPDLGSTENRIQNVVGHSVQLNSLTPQTDYHYKVKSCYNAECIESFIINFATSATDVTAPVINFIYDAPDPVRLGNVIFLEAQVSDQEGNTDRVWAEVNGVNNGSFEAIPIGEGIYVAEVDISNSIYGFSVGDYNYNFYAEDTSGNSAETIQGTFKVVDIDPPFRAAEIKSVIWATDNIAHYLDGDAYINEYIYNPDWVWELDDIDTANKFGIENDFVIDDDSDNPPSVGEYIGLPEDFLRIYFNEVIETLYVTYNIEVVSLDLTSFGGGAEDSVIGINVNAVGELKLLAANLDNLDVDTLTSDVFIKVIDLNTYGVYYYDNYGNLNFAGDIVVNGNTFLEADSNNGEIAFAVMNYGNDYVKVLLENAMGEAVDLLFDIDVNYVNLGYLANTAEASEIRYKDEFGDWNNLGTKNTDLRMAYGIVIKNPALNSLNNKVILEMPAFYQVGANVLVTDQSGLESNGVSANTNLARDITEVVGTNFDTNDILSLQDTVIGHNGNFYNAWDELKLGEDGFVNRQISIETSLTSREDDYGKDMFIEVMNRDAIKYYYNLDIALDVNQLSENLPIGIEFLGKKLIVTELVNQLNIDAGVAEEAQLREGESAVLYGKNVLVNSINFETASVSVDVDGVSATVNIGEMALVNGLHVFNYDLIGGAKAIPNQIWDEDASNNNAFDLDDYFIGEEIVYSVSGNDQIIVNIDENDIVSFSQASDWYGEESVIFRATNEAGFEESNVVVLTVNDVEEKIEVVSDPAPSSGGGGSGGGGGGSKNTLPRVEKSWSSLEKGENAVFKIFNSEIGLTEINFNAENPVKNVKVIVEKLAGKPAEITKQVNGRVDRYLEISNKNIEDSDMSDAIIKFKIAKTSVKKDEEAALYRYNNERWEKLETKLIGQDLTHKYYEAVSSGFSYFAIGVNAKPIETVPETSDVIKLAGKDAEDNHNGNGGDEITGAAVGINSDSMSIIALVVAGVLVVGLVFYFVYKRR